MPYPRPTLTQLWQQAAADIAANLPGADALLRYTNLGVLAKVIAAAINGVFGYVDWVARQCTPFTATGEYLEAWAALKNVFRSAATAARGQLQFTGTSGELIPAATPIVRADGRAYVSTADATVIGGVATVTIVDTTPGAAGNSQSGTQFTLGVGIAGVTSTGAASTAITGGADPQTDASLRTDMLKAYAAPPQGGDLADYVNWALQVPGVTRAWTVGSALGAGTVQVYAMLDDAEAAFGGFPQGTNGVAANETRDTAATGDQLTIANHIFPLRPVTALVYVYAPVTNPVAMTISQIAGVSTAIKAAIAAAFAQVLLEQAAPGGVTDAQGNPVGLVDLSYVEAAIAQIAGTAGFVITSVSCPHGTVTPGGDGNVESNTGYLATPGVITYV